MDLGTDQTKRITADLDRPLPSLGSGTAFRLNLMGHDSKFAGRDIAESRRYGIAPSLAFGLGTPTRFTLSYLHEGSDDTPDYGIPWLFNGPAPVERRNYYGFEHGNYLKTNVDMGTVKFEHDVNSHITFRNQARYAHYHRDVRITEPQIDPTTLDADPLTTPLGQIGVLRNQITVDSTETFLQDQADVIMKFNTGSLRHTVVAGAEGGRETSSPYRQRFDLTTVPTTNLLHPDTSQPFAGIVPGTGITDTHVTAISAGAYAHRYRQSAAQARPHRRGPRGPVRCHGQPVFAGNTRFAVQAGGRHAQLARCAGIQTRGRRKHLLRLRHIVQPFRRDPGAQRGHSRTRRPSRAGRSKWAPSGICSRASCRCGQRRSAPTRPTPGKP